MKLVFLCVFLFLGCEYPVKLTEVKRPSTDKNYVKPVEIVAKTKDVYQLSCEKNGELYHWQNNQWKKIQNELDPLESFMPYLMNDVYYPQTASGLGCDQIRCRVASSSISFDLAEYKKTGEKPNPKYVGKPRNEYGVEVPEIIPNYKATLLSGRFKATYLYYKDDHCTQKATEEIEFEVP